jgi:hypothetical protein
MGGSLVAVPFPSVTHMPVGTDGDSAGVSEVLLVVLVVLVVLLVLLSMRHSSGLCSLPFARLSCSGDAPAAAFSFFFLRFASSCSTFCASL